MLIYVKSILIIIAFNWLLLGCVYGQANALYEGQVVNITDKNNLKQGLWVYFYDTLHTMVSCKGNFVDDKREGVWTNFYRSGKVKSTITFSENRESGYVKFFYENGQVSEEGLWVNNHWVGEYRYYYSNGQLAYRWNHDENGRRTGQQQYFYENGKVRITGNWVEGMEDGQITEYYEGGRVRSESQWKNGFTDGVMKEYYEDGSLSAEYVFNNGIYDAVASRVYRERKKPREETEVNPPEPDNNEPALAVTHEDNPAIFTGSGYHKFYGNNKKIDREGEFQNGTLVNGKRYYYDTNGKLIRTAIYENGRIVNTIDNE